MRAAAELRHERLGPCRVASVAPASSSSGAAPIAVGITVGDVAGADEHDPHRSHPSSCSRIAAISSLGS